MRLAIILRTTGALLVLFSPAMLLPAFVAWIYEESTARTFAVAFGITLAGGIALWISGRGRIGPMEGDGFLVTALAYIGLGLCGAIPFMLDDSTRLSFTEAAFESLSGITTTGASLMTGLDGLPKSILFYRQFLQWVGGMGIIVLAVAILPMLGVGGMQLYRAESPGPVKDNKLTPRITQTAKALWLLYLGLTSACALAYWIAGMSVFDAICHSFSTVAIGGFSTYDASIGHFNSAAIEGVAIAFMVFSGINFALHFTAWNRRTLNGYARDREVRFYLAVLVGMTLIVWVLLGRDPQATASPFRDGLFQAVSITTTTGFTTTNFSLWPSVIPILLMFGAFAGGCAGSTAGGLKMIRVLLIYRQCVREIRRLIHPLGVFPLKLAGEKVPGRVADAVWSFFMAYIMIFVILVCLVMAAGNFDFLTAFSAVGACLNNLGPGLGDVAANYAGLPETVSWLLMLAMVLGRLEIFTLLVILSRSYWRR